MTYRHREICGFTGSSVELSCSYPETLSSTWGSGWFRKSPPNMKLEPLTLLPGYLNRITYVERGTNNCTLKLADLKKSDATVYYFIYSYRNFMGRHVACKGVPGVRLKIFDSPVGILVEKLVRGQNGPVANYTVTEGQKIRLTCVHTCAMNLNYNPGYIWYKNSLQLNGSRANSPFLSLGSVSNKDTGSYVCVMIGYKDLPSSAVILTVQKKPRGVSDNLPDGGSKMDRVPTAAHDCDTQNFVDHIFNCCQTRKGKRMFIYAIAIVSVCVGLVIAIMVAVILLDAKKKKSRRCDGSVPAHPSPNSDVYMDLGSISTSAVYDTLDTERCSSAPLAVYSNIRQPE